jgi:hypothetical protein
MNYRFIAGRRDIQKTGVYSSHCRGMAVREGRK